MRGGFADDTRSICPHRLTAVMPTSPVTRQRNPQYFFVFFFLRFLIGLYKITYMSNFRILDLFCGAGGAAMGYHRAGFEVVGVDLNPQKNYPFEFHQTDALTFPIDGFDAIHASPPCQAHTCLKTMWNAKKHTDLIKPTRERLNTSGLPWVIENVPGAPISASFVLCGTMFGLGLPGVAELRRHRHFESNAVFGLVPQCSHGSGVIGVYGGHGRDRRRLPTIGVYGGGHGTSLHRAQKGQRNFTAGQERQAMGIDWMTVNELSQAIPPAYTEFIGKQLMEFLTSPILLSP
jgi:DNA (cytosine-5)-methyltransferase 1